jgi:hypothetical protein
VLDCVLFFALARLNHEGRELTMSFQAYLDDVKAKAGRHPNALATHRENRSQKLLGGTSGFVVETCVPSGEAQSRARSNLRLSSHQAVIPADGP